MLFSSDTIDSDQVVYRSESTYSMWDLACLGFACTMLRFSVVVFLLFCDVVGVVIIHKIIYSNLAIIKI